MHIRTIQMSFEGLPLGRKFSGLIVTGVLLSKVFEYYINHVKNPNFKDSTEEEVKVGIEINLCAFDGRFGLHH